MPMPSHSPLYPPLPHRYHRVQWCTVVCETDGEKIGALLPEPLERDRSQRQRFEIFAGFYPDTPYGRYTEAGVIVPCRFGETVGQTFLFLYLDNVAAICAGRELIGFPKKDGDVIFEKQGSRVLGTVTRQGTELLRIEAELDPAAEPTERLPMGPRLQVRAIPSAHGPGLDLLQVYRKDFDPSFFQVHERSGGQGTAILRSGPADPIGELGPFEVLGVSYAELDFSLGYSQLLHTEAPALAATSPR